MVIVWVGGLNTTIIWSSGIRRPSKLVIFKPIRKSKCHRILSSPLYLGKFLLVERYKGVRGVGGDGSGGLFRELMPK